MLAKRIIPCLDVRGGKVTKGIKFLDNADVGDPVAMARYYYEQGADELVFYDITASNERRGIMLEVVNAVAKEIFIPFSVGGGLRTLEDMRAVLLAGAEKVSIDSGAVRNPEIISQGARAFGSQCIVPRCRCSTRGAKDCPRVMKWSSTGAGFHRARCGGLGARRRAPGRRRTVINSIDRDGTRSGYDLEITGVISESVSIPVVASGGAGAPENLRDAFVRGAADAAIVASIVHYGEHPIPDLKRYLRGAGVEVRDATGLEAPAR